jgi:hypothetical protein
VHACCEKFGIRNSSEQQKEVDQRDEMFDIGKGEFPDPWDALSIAFAAIRHVVGGGDADSTPIGLVTTK